VGPGVMTRHCDCNDLDCQTHPIEHADAKNKFPRCKIGRTSTPQQKPRPFDRDFLWEMLIAIAKQPFDDQADHFGHGRLPSWKRPCTSDCLFCLYRGASLVGRCPAQDAGKHRGGPFPRSVSCTRLSSALLTKFYGINCRCRIDLWFKRYDRTDNVERYDRTDNVELVGDGYAIEMTRLSRS